MFSVSFYTMGCNINMAETDKLRAMFLDSGYSAAEGDGADVIILNTCAVTSTADRGARQLLRRLREKNPRAVIALVGCLGELLDKHGDAALPEADILLGNDKLGVVDRVSALVAARKPRAGDSEAPAHEPQPRAYVQIQNGCDRFCSYCIVPHLRGGPVSTPLDALRRELGDAGARGVKEVVLSGVNLALYGHDGHTLVDVLRAADAVEGIKRVRLSSLEPAVVSDAFLEALPTLKKLCPHFHISLQSGCDDTLAAMNRGYVVGGFLTMLDRLRAAMPGVAVTTDVIVGFPGESDDAFRESCRNIVRCRFDDIHIFKYSKRGGTAAADMPGHVTEHKKILRAAQLAGIKQQARYSFLHAFIGKRMDVLFTNLRMPGAWEGATPHNADVRVCSDAPLRGELRAVHIEGVNESGDGLIGRLAE